MVFKQSNGYLYLNEIRPLTQIVRRHLHFHFIPGKNLDVVHSHLAGDMGRDHVAVIQLHRNIALDQRLDDRTVPIRSQFVLP